MFTLRYGLGPSITQTLFVLKGLKQHENRNDQNLKKKAGNNGTHKESLTHACYSVYRRLITPEERSVIGIDYLWDRLYAL